MIVQEQTKTEVLNVNNSVKITITIIIFVWFILGIAGFIMSLVCFGRSGTTAQHVIGLLLAIFFGPIYWIFYLVVPDYCKRLFT
jgi:hypothetical protein